MKFHTSNVTNEEVLERVDQTRKLLAMVTTRKLKYFGHISRHASLENDITQRLWNAGENTAKTYIPIPPGQRKQWLFSKLVAKIDASQNGQTTQYRT